MNTTFQRNAKMTVITFSIVSVIVRLNLLKLLHNDGITFTNNLKTV